MNPNLSSLLQRRLNSFNINPLISIQDTQNSINLTYSRRSSSFIPEISQTHPVKNNSDPKSLSLPPDELITVKYRVKGVLVDDFTLTALSKTNKVLKGKVLRARQKLLKQMASHNERPPFTPRSIKFEPVSIPLLKTQERKLKSSKVISSFSETVNFIDHNKQTLYNIKARSPRPVTDKVWVKKIRKSAYFQKNESFDCGVELRNHWKTRPDSGVCISDLDFGEFNGEVVVNPNYTYCGSCGKDSSPLSLKGKNMRPRAIFTRTLH